MSHETPCSNLKMQLKFFSIGVILGCVGGILWQEILSPIHLPPNMTNDEEYNILLSDTNERLLKYIEGHWRSSIGDLYINIDNSESNGSFIVTENTNPPHTEKEFKISEIIKINGFLGLVKLNICKIDTPCNDSDKIPVQINKVFGIDKTISISYDTRLSYCIPSDGLCTRSFKQSDVE